MTLKFEIDTDEPVVVAVAVMPLRKAAPRSVPPFPVARQVVETTGSDVADNVVPLRRAVGA